MRPFRLESGRNPAWKQVVKRAVRKLDGVQAVQFPCTPPDLGATRDRCIGDAGIARVLPYVTLINLPSLRIRN